MEPPRSRTNPALSPLSAMRRIILLAFLVFTAMTLGCGDDSPTSPTSSANPNADLGSRVPYIPFPGAEETAFPAAIRLSSAPGLNNRHTYEITQPPWGSPHRTIGDDIWRVWAYQVGDDGALVGDALDEPAPFTRATPMTLGADLVWTGPDGELPDALDVHVEAVLRSTTSEGIEVPILSTDTTVAARSEVHFPDDTAGVAFEVLSVQTDALPTRVDLWSLELIWTLTPMRDGEPTADAPRVSRTRHLVPTFLRDPNPDAPRYKRPMLWSAAFAAGEWDDEGDAVAETEHRIAMAELEGVRSLADLGFRYGGFPRPPHGEFKDRVDLFLDFEQTACGEFRGIMMALVEYHGLDARWFWFRFPELDSEHFALYKTRDISAVGQPSGHWFNTNHIVVTVNGKVYDPTYTVYKESWQEYEDWMFERYCPGRDAPCSEDRWCSSPPLSEDGCIDNPPGFDRDWDLEAIDSDGYK